MPLSRTIFLLWQKNSCAAAAAPTAAAVAPTDQSFGKSPSHVLQAQLSLFLACVGNYFFGAGILCVLILNDVLNGEESNYFSSLLLLFLPQEKEH